jgi:hypothetical protein
MTDTPSAKHSSRDAAAQRLPKSQGAPAIVLSDSELERVSGGDAAISPRDAASGLPTGKRMHKPI